MNESEARYQQTQDARESLGQDSIPAWRKLEPADRTDFYLWAKTSLMYREELGEKKYRSREKGFQGDPFEHLEEELLDALFYLWIEKRRQGLEGNDPESRIYRAVQLLLEGTYYDHEERVTINGMLFRMNAIRTRKPQQGDGPISMNIRLTHVPHEEPESIPIEEPETEEGEASEECLGLIFLEQGSLLYTALLANRRPDGHTKDCGTGMNNAPPRSSSCSALCKSTDRAIKTWEERPALAPSRRKPDEIVGLAPNQLEYQGTIPGHMSEQQRRESQGHSPTCNCPSPSVDHADALVELTRDEADRLDGQSRHADNDE